jgi:hypothetical protein
MTVSYNFDGVPQPPTTTALTTAEGDIATPIGKGMHRVLKIRVANSANTSCKVDLYWYDGVALASKLFYHAIVAADTSIEVDDPVIYATEGTTATKLRATAEANSKLTATVFVAVTGGHQNAPG